MTVLRINRGIPASGKTTDALAWVAESPNTRIRINRDDIRFQLFGKYWPVNELAVTESQNAMLRVGLKKWDVVLDNTNLKSQDVKSVLKIAQEAGAEVEFKDFPINPKIAIQRDMLRGMEGGREVGAKVIQGFYDRYITDKTGILPPIPTIDSTVSTAFEPYVFTPGLPRCIIVDIDGTLAHMDDRRGPYDDTKYHLDRLDEHIAGIVEAWRSGGSVRVVIMSGRDELFREATEAWLKYYGVHYDDLFMRWHEEGNRKTEDSIVKNKLFQDHIAGKYNVDFVLDDRDRVVKMWRAKGLKCLQVADGDF